MNNDIFKDQDHREDKLNDEQIDQVSGGGDPHGKNTDPPFQERPKTGLLIGAVGDMKKDPA